MKIMKTKILLYLSLILALGACYPGGADYYSDLDVTYTNYDDEFDFASLRTYAMPDSIVKVEGDLAEGEEPEIVKEPYNTQMLTRISSNMEALGWTRIDNPEEADLVLFPAAWTNTTVYYWYDYWCWYWYYYCGWGWGYPTVSTYTTGTLVMALIADGEDYIDPTHVWTGAVNGLLAGSYNSTRVNNAIDQAFAQSPYLKTN